MNGLRLALDCPGDRDFRLRLDCELPDRGVTAIYGPSGSGKSTLLDCIAGLRQPLPGSHIQFRTETWQRDAQFVPPWRRGIGYVFQDARLFEHLSVQGNLDFASRRRARPGPIATGTVIELLELADLLDRSPQVLSAGQKQRVAIGRALLSAPGLLLLDEPLANLDHVASLQCLACLQRLADQLELPMLYVSHDIEEVSQLADHLLLLDQGQAVDQGSALDLCSRLDSRLSHQEQAAAIAVGEITRHDTAFGLTQLNIEGQPLLVSLLHQAIGQRRRVRIPARDVSICRQRPTHSSILNILPVTLAEIEESTGPRILLRLALGSQYLLARITRKSAIELELRVGDQLFAQVKSAALLMEATDEC